MATNTMSTPATGQKVGKIVQVIGSTFDAEFEEGHLPEIYNALRIDTDVKGRHLKLTGEVQQHLGGNRVRCVALGSTDGLVRGMRSEERRVGKECGARRQAEQSEHK